MNEKTEKQTPETPEPEAPAPEEAGQAEAGPAAPEAEGGASALAEEVAQLRDQLLRAMAETENVRKRGERQVEEAHKYAVTSFARDVLTVADNLDRAVEAVPSERRGENELVENLLGGVEAVRTGLAQLLAQHHIERIDPLGTPFDPNLHEAMFEVPGTDYPDGTVAQVLQPGYRLHDRLLRPARVGVARGAGEARVDTTA